MDIRAKPLSIAFSLIVFIAILSCSSSPKRPMLVTQTADAAASFYETANAELLCGKIGGAGGHLQQAYNLALSVDDCELLCRISLSAVIYKLSVEGEAEKSQPEIYSETPFYGLSSYNMLSLARSYASRSDSAELLSAVCFLYEIRIRLAKGEEIDSDEVLASIKSSSKVLSHDSYYYAFMFRTEGDLYAYSGNFDEARNSYLLAARIHIKERYLDEIGLDYYNAARMSSLAGSKQDAIQEINIALKYDRDAENTSAIAADYFAYGLILIKGGCSEEEKQQARNAMLWAADIYQAGEYEEDAARCRQKAESL